MSALAPQNVAWFDMHNEPKAIPQLGHGFVNVQSVADLDEQIDGDACHASKRRKTAPGPIAVNETDFAQRWQNGGSKGLITDLTMDDVSPLHNSRNARIKSETAKKSSCT